MCVPAAILGSSEKIEFVEMKRPASKQPKGILKRKSLKKDDGSKQELNAANLKKLGELSLEDKIKAVAAEHEEPEEAAESLKKALTQVEKSNAWNQHQAHLKKKGNEAEKEEFDSMDKMSKGTATALFLLKKGQAVFGKVSKAASTETSLKKREKWLTEKEVYNKWTEDEINSHLASGRLVSRECPKTWGIWEYMDTMDLEKEFVGKNTSQWKMQPEYELAEEEDQVEWQKVLEKDLHSLMLGSLEKGKGKGKGKSLEKGKGKTKTSGGRTNQLPLEDQQEETTTCADLPEALKKARKLRDMLNSTHSNFEEALKKVAKSPYLSKASKGDKEQVLQQLSKMLQSTKKVLEKGEKNKLEAVNLHLKEGVALLKDAKGEAKELVQLSFKAASKASSSKRG